MSYQINNCCSWRCATACMQFFLLIKPICNLRSADAFSTGNASALRRLTNLIWLFSLLTWPEGKFLNASSSLFVYIQNSGLILGAGLKKGKEERKANEKEKPVLILINDSTEINCLFNNYSSSPNGLFTQRPWGKEE